MAIYHFSLKTHSRAANRSTTSSAAYRAGCNIVDERTGEVFDFSRKRGVLHAQVILPGGGTADRSVLWNGVEAAHKRKDAVVGREVVIALPKELNDKQRTNLAVNFARHLADRYGVATDVCLHEPHKYTDKELKNKPELAAALAEGEGKHNSNWHAHILMSACKCDKDMKFGSKVVEFDTIHCLSAKGRKEGLIDFITEQRPLWTEFANKALEKAGSEARIDHRSNKDRGIEEPAQKHKGPAVTAIERGRYSDSKKTKGKVLKEPEKTSVSARIEGQERARKAEIETRKEAQKAKASVLVKDAQTGYEKAQAALNAARAELEAAKGEQKQLDEKAKAAALAAVKQAEKDAQSKLGLLDKLKKAAGMETSQEKDERLKREEAARIKEAQRIQAEKQKAEDERRKAKEAADRQREIKEAAEQAERWRRGWERDEREFRERQKVSDERYKNNPKIGVNAERGSFYEVQNHDGYFGVRDGVNGTAFHRMLKEQGRWVRAPNPAFVARPGDVVVLSKEQQDIKAAVAHALRNASQELHVTGDARFKAQVINEIAAQGGRVTNQDKDVQTLFKVMKYQHESKRAGFDPTKAEKPSLEEFEAARKFMREAMPELAKQADEKAQAQAQKAQGQPTQGLGQGLGSRLDRLRQEREANAAAAQSQGKEKGKSGPGLGV